MGEKVQQYYCCRCGALCERYRTTRATGPSTRKNVWLSRCCRAQVNPLEAR